MLSFEKLTPTRFEEFCYDLLHELGFKKISWRKGSSGEGSTNDQGRDIECVFETVDPDGEIRPHRWFVECKHHSRAIAPEHLQPAVAWAQANRPDVLLVACSGFVSNPTKEMLEKLGQSPQFPKVRIWENKDLERLCFPRQQILVKYEIGPAQSFVSQLHPIHLEFLRSPPLNSFSALFKLLEALNPKVRDHVISFAQLGLINPTFTKVEDSEQTIGELLHPTLTYFEFKKKCLKLRSSVAENFLVQAIVLQSLSYTFAQGDKTRIAEIKASNRAIISAHKTTSANSGGISDFVTMLKDKQTTIEDDFAQNYRDYCTFCTKVVAGLLIEQSTEMADFIVPRSAQQHPEGQDMNFDEDVPF